MGYELGNDDAGLKANGQELKAVSEFLK